MHQGFIVLSYLYNNREHLQEKISGTKYLKETSLGTIPQVFHDDVLEQYGNAIHKIVVEDIAMNTSVDVETILVTLDEVNWKGYLE